MGTSQNKSKFSLVIATSLMARRAAHTLALRFEGDLSELYSVQCSNIAARGQRVTHSPFQ